MNRRISVAFSNMLDASWPGGSQYLYNLLYAIKSCDMDIKPVLRVLPGTPREELTMLDGLIEQILEVPPVPSWLQRLPGGIAAVAAQVLSQEDRRLRANKVQAQFLILNPGSARFVPSAIWIPDFQHLHFPEFFTRPDLEYRAAFYPAAARRARLVVLSSQSALEDLQKVAPETTGKARVLRFVPHIPEDVYKIDPFAIANQYHLPERYFFLPNLFWRHKNHQLVIDALEIAKKTTPALTVVCSGGTYDHRNPAYFDSLLTEIARRDLQSNFRILGRIPRADVLPLMRQSLAVLQPSLFEGWSTSVEETISLGKQILLSDQPVHREQDPPSALYFSASGSAELAELLLKLYAEKSPGPDADLEARARDRQASRLEGFAQTFYGIIAEMVGL